MPYFGDYLGQLLGEISIARAQADLETVRLAQIYATDPLLRTLPVPRVRVPTVELDIPMVVETSNQPDEDEPRRGSAATAELRKKFDSLLATQLKQARISLSRTDARALKIGLDEAQERSEALPETSVNVRPLADDLTSTALSLIQAGRPAEAPQLSADISRAFLQTVRREFVKLVSAPPRLSVFVTGSDIRETATPENLTRVRVTVSEQCLEWTSIESAGTQREFLVPE